jgi:DNA invertase Pin-like site-specific DNA recombinase
MGERYGIYCRISYVKRDGKVETLGVDRQEPPCRALVERLGGIVADVYVDNDISAYSGKRRPSYERMLGAAQMGAIDGIVAWHPDRLTRQPSENERLISLAESCGTKLATAQAGECDLSTASGRLTFRLLGNIARYESEHKAARIMLKNDQMAQAGEPAPAPRSFGYEPGGMVVRESEATIIREAVKRLRAGESMGAIVRDFRDRGITGAGNKRFPGGKPFTTTSLRNVLINPRIAGIRVLRGQEAGPGAWPTIISDEDLRAVRRIFEQRSNAARKAKGEAPYQPGRGRTYAYSGLLVCHACGGRLAGSSGAYRCQACRKTYIQAEPFEQVMDAAVEAQVCRPEFAAWRAERLAELGADDRTAEQLERDQAELTDLEQLPERYRGQIDPGGKRAAELGELIREAKARMAARPELGALADLPTTVAAFRAVWARWTPEQRRARLAAVLDHVTIRPARHRHVFDPGRIVPRWK